MAKTLGMWSEHGDGWKAQADRQKSLDETRKFLSQSHPHLGGTPIPTPGPWGGHIDSSMSKEDQARYVEDEARRMHVAAPTFVEFMTDGRRYAKAELDAKMALGDLQAGHGSTSKFNTKIGEYNKLLSDEWAHTPLFSTTARAQALGFERTRNRLFETAYAGREYLSESTKRDLGEDYAKFAKKEAENEGTTYYKYIMAVKTPEMDEVEFDSGYVKFGPAATRKCMLLGEKPVPDGMTPGVLLVSRSCYADRSEYGYDTGTGVYADLENEQGLQLLGKSATVYGETARLTPVTDPVELRDVKNIDKAMTEKGRIAYACRLPDYPVVSYRDYKGNNGVAIATGIGPGRTRLDILMHDTSTALREMGGRAEADMHRIGDRYDVLDEDLKNMEPEHIGPFVNFAEKFAMKDGRRDQFFDLREHMLRFEKPGEMPAPSAPLLTHRLASVPNGSQATTGEKTGVKSNRRLPNVDLPDGNQLGPTTPDYIP